MQSPPLGHWQRYPVTVGIGLAAMALTAWTGLGEHINPQWRMTDQFWSGQIWRPFTSCLMHGDILHLIFNLYWLWVFGAVIEEFFHSARMFLIVVFLALGSSLAQYAFSGPGIGLSGVVYGLFGLLWVLRRSNRRFYDVLDDSVVKLMTVWFFICIALTAANVWKIGNVAHGSGAILGAMLGFAIVEKDKKRRLGYVLLLTFSLLAIFAASSVGRKYVNFSGDVELENEIRASEIAGQGNRAFDAGEYRRAADFYSQALKLDKEQAAYWYNLGLCKLNLGEREQAIENFRHALQLQPEDKGFKKVLERYAPSQEKAE